MYSFELENVKCNGCVNKITQTLSSIPGVTEVKVDLETKMLSFDANEEKKKEVENVLKEIGYPKKDDDLLAKAKNYLNNNQ